MKRQEWLLGSLDGPLSLRLSHAALLRLLLIALGCALLALIALRSGNLGDGLAALLHDTAPSPLRTVVLQWRLPRIVFALLFGAALGMSGAIFQALIRNPLGSPDLIGFSSGAHTGALVTLIVLQGGHFQVALGAIAGGLASAALVWLLARGQGLQGLRLVLIGIGFSALLAAFNTWLSLHAQLDAAMNAALWGAGSLNGLGWQKGLPAAAIAGLALIAALGLQRRLNLLELGDASAASLGLDTPRLRRQLLLLGVVLSAAATAACGPISFIALCAPSIARRLRGGLASSAGLGALLLLAADLLAQHAFAPRQLPAGLVTGCVGGIYLLVLLRRFSSARP